MNKENFKFVIPDAQNTELAQKVSSWTQGEKMLQKTPEDMADMFQKKHSIVAYDGDKPVGHAGLTYDWGNNFYEVGAVVVDASHRGQKIGTEAVKALLIHAKELYPDVTPFALANGLSEGLFIGIGGTSMPTTELPEAVWDACEGCVFKPKQEEGGVFMCCDTPYNLTQAGGL